VSVLISARVLRMIERSAAVAADGREIGGILLGFDAPVQERFWVTEASEAGPVAERRPTYFRRDLDFVSWVAERAFAIDGSQWIGDWHTHPGGPPEPSGTDLASWREALAASDLSVFLALILVPGAERGWEHPSRQAWAVTAASLRALAVEDLFDRSAAS
jgi:integrative and conjugative element protein (TIGR02256 family)